MRRYRFHPFSELKRMPSVGDGCGRQGACPTPSRQAANDTADSTRPVCPMGSRRALPAREGSAGRGGETTIMGLGKGISEREPAAIRGARGGTSDWAEGN